MVRTSPPTSPSCEPLGESTDLLPRVSTPPVSRPKTPYVVHALHAVLSVFLAPPKFLLLQCLRCVRAVQAFLFALLWYSVTIFFMILLVIMSAISWGFALLIKPHKLLRAMMAVLPLPGKGKAASTSPNVRDHVVPLGYEFEEHEVPTEDGHILTLFHIFKKECVNTSTFIPVLCQHGVLQNSGVFIANGRKSPALALAEQGFDIWLGNNRGVFPKHTTLKTTDKSFWDFTLDELGLYDFPAMVDYVSNFTHKKIVYIGHSQGASQALIGLQNVDRINDSLILFAALAPAYYLPKMPHWLFTKIMLPFSNSMQYILGENDFMPIMFTILSRVPSLIVAIVGCMFTRYIFGWDPEIWDPNQFVTYFLFSPAKTSAKLVHGWLKMLKSGFIHPLRHSGAWGLDRIRCRTAIIYGEADSLVDCKPLQKQLLEGACKLTCFVGIPNYNHMDLLWAESSTTLVHIPLLEQIHQAMQESTELNVKSPAQEAHL